MGSPSIPRLSGTGLSPEGDPSEVAAALPRGSPCGGPTSGAAFVPFGLCEEKVQTLATLRLRLDLYEKLKETWWHSLR